MGFWVSTTVAGSSEGLNSMFYPDANNRGGNVVLLKMETYIFVCCSAFSWAVPSVGSGRCQGNLFRRLCKGVSRRQGKVAPPLPLIGSARACVQLKSFIQLIPRSPSFCSAYFILPNVLTQFRCSHYNKKKKIMGLPLLTGLWRWRWCIKLKMIVLVCGK